MRDRVYLLGGLRSHIGIRYGIFKTVRPEVLGGEILHRVWSKYGKSALPDLVLCGNAVRPWRKYRPPHGTRGGSS